MRVPVKPDRFRVPDVVAVKGTKPNQRVLMEPPVLAVEIFSPEDRMSSMWQRIDVCVYHAGERGGEGRIDAGWGVGDTLGGYF